MKFFLIAGCGTAQSLYSLTASLTTNCWLYHANWSQTYRHVTAAWWLYTKAELVFWMWKVQLQGVLFSWYGGSQTSLHGRALINISRWKETKTGATEKSHKFYTSAQYRFVLCSGYFVSMHLSMSWALVNHSICWTDIILCKGTQTLPH